jgi:ornithine cyclodeaminase/alanine dehydrogenase-like protein (mu-crystallin family)
MTELPWIGAADIAALLPMARAIDAVEAALLGGLDPASEPARSRVDTANGHLLLMPSEGAEFVGVKVASVTPGNPARGLPRIQAGYLLFDGATLTPRALLDGAQLTSLRTPALSGVAGRHLARPAAHRVVVFGTGPQAYAHMEAMCAIRPIDDIAVVGRDPGRAAPLVAKLAEAGLAAQEGSRADVAEADVVVCATSSKEPVFDGTLLSSSACVLACGSHEPDARELDNAVMSRGYVVVEDAATALRETGDVIRAVADGALRPDVLVGLADVVTGRSEVPDDRPRVFTSVGMAWEDLAVAAEVYRRWNGSV